MVKVNKVVSMVIAACFLFNTAVSDLAFGQTLNYRANTDKLAAPLATSDIAGIQHKDIARIKIALEAQLMALNSSGPSVTMNTFRTELGQQRSKEKTIFQPADMQFFFQEIEATRAGVCVKIRLKDRQGPRTYYATFTLLPDKDAGFHINVYTEKQYKETNAFKNASSRVSPEDARAIQRYIDHEKGVDTLIADAHKKGLAKKPLVEKYNYQDEVLKLFNILNIKVENPNNLTPIEDREFFLIPMTREILQKMHSLPMVRVPVEGGADEVELFCEAHSSNGAMHIFVDVVTFDALTKRNKVSEKVMNAANMIVSGTIAHEIAAICNQEMLEYGLVSESGLYTDAWWVNILDQRYADYIANDGDIPEHELMLQIADLDQNLMTRDYAAGGVNFGKLCKQIAVKLNWPQGQIFVNYHPNGKRDEFTAGVMGDNAILGTYSFKLNKKREITGLKKEPSDLSDLDRTHPGKSPSDTLNLIKIYFGELPDGIISAPAVLKLYHDQYEEMGFEAPAKKRASALKTVERDLFAAGNSLEKQGKIVRLKTRGKNGEFLFRLAVKYFEYKDLKVQIQTGKNSTPATATLTTISPSALFQAGSSNEGSFVGVVDFIEDSDITKYEYQLFEDGKIVRFGTKTGHESFYRDELQEGMLSPDIAEIRRLILNESTRQWLQVSLWAGAKVIVLPNGRAYYLMSPDENPNDISISNPIDCKENPILSQLSPQIGQYLTAMSTNPAIARQEIVDGYDAMSNSEAKSHNRSGKSPQDALNLIKRYFEELPDGIISAPAVLKLYHDQYEEMGFEAPAKKRASALKTVERDLFAAGNSLEKQGKIVRLKTRGKNGEFLFKLDTGKQIPASSDAAQGRSERSEPKVSMVAAPFGYEDLKVQIQRGEDSTPIIATLTTILPAALLQNRQTIGSFFMGDSFIRVIDLSPHPTIRQYEYKLFEDGKVARLGTTKDFKSTGPEMLQEDELPSNVAELRRLVLNESTRQWLKIGLWKGTNIIVLPNGNAYHFISSNDPEDISIANSVDWRTDPILSQLSWQISQYLTAMSTNPAIAQQNIAAMILLAHGAGLQIPTHPNNRYNLLVTSEFFANGELKDHQQAYSDRFNVDAVSGSTADQFIQNVLNNPNAVKDRTIVLLPNELAQGKFEESHFQMLKDAGIRFIITDRNELLTAKTDKDAYRAKFQQDTYAVMLLVRSIDDTMTADSPIYRLLDFYLKTRFSFTDKIAVDDYIMAIANSDILKLIKGCLLYRPAQAYDTPNYNNVAASLMSA